MKAVVFHGVGDIRLDDVEEPKIQEPTDAIVRLTSSSICGTDLHMIRGTMSGMREGTILGHEGVLCGICNCLQTPATLDRALVAGAGVSGSSPLAGSPNPPSPS